MDRNNRPEIVGPEAPEHPYPLRIEATVIAGFGRGSSDLGIPTANIPQDAVDKLDLPDTGIYYGWACVYKNTDDEISGKPEGGREVDYSRGEGLDQGIDSEIVLPMVMSVGWNPFYSNAKKSAEIHIMHKFKCQFYGAKMRLIILGYIRPELDYISKDALIDDINTDIKVAERSLNRPVYRSYKNDEFLSRNKLYV